MSAAAGKVVIIGAGMVGSTFAYALQIHGAARETVLIDTDEERAEAEALDLGHGAFFTAPVDVLTYAVLKISELSRRRVVGSGA